MCGSVAFVKILKIVCNTKEVNTKHEDNAHFYFNNKHLFPGNGNATKYLLFSLSAQRCSRYDCRVFTIQRSRVRCEFIKRALDVYQLPQPLSLCNDFDKPGFLANESYGYIASYLIDRSKILLVEKHYSPTQITRVAIIDLKKKKTIFQEDLKEFIKEEMSFVKYLTCSQDGKLIARLLFERYHIGRIERIFYRYKLLITNRNNHEEAQFIIPEELYEKCEFNKTGTKIVAFRKDNQNKIQHHIYQISNEKDHTIKSQKTLSEYLRQHIICKDLKKSL